ncbi:hypothetical protein [Vibrio parahaemolyticus]|uniref:hypothetical protein n=1 Tax=Vibrio parahaemolyticus TaxID=670 RepID=UPI002269EEBD|nr:hypothetical protein [Vibrio parahaemolyticus]MCX8795955.1 hypothetical protein [Vibrio parahaemolyticus]
MKSLILKASYKNSNLKKILFSHLIYFALFIAGYNLFLALSDSEITKVLEKLTPYIFLFSISSIQSEERFRFIPKLLFMAIIMLANVLISVAMFEYYGTLPTDEIITSESSGDTTFKACALLFLHFCICKFISFEFDCNEKKIIEDSVKNKKTEKAL